MYDDLKKAIVNMLSTHCVDYGIESWDEFEEGDPIRQVITAFNDVVPSPDQINPQQIIDNAMED